MDEIKNTEQRKTTFAWASIAGADPEPVELVEVNGRKGAYTLGCADPFWLDEGVVAVFGNELRRPKNPETAEIMEAKQKAYDWHRENSKHGPYCEAAGCVGARLEGRHGWRGPR